ncbi:MAG: hypothetical protein VW453_02730 [Rhodospirillaceae bacterium]
MISITSGSSTLPRSSADGALLAGAAGLVDHLAHLECLGLGVKQVLGDLARLAAHQGQLLDEAPVAFRLGKHQVRERAGDEHDARGQRRQVGCQGRHERGRNQRHGGRQHEIGRDDYDMQNQ